MKARPPIPLGDNLAVPASECVNCRKQLDGATCVGSGGTPGTGDFTVCIYCGHLMMFADDMRLRDPTDAEMIDIAGDERLIAIQRARSKVEW